MIAAEKIQAATEMLVQVAHPKKIMLFGSYARGDASEDSDVDFLVIEDEVPDRAREMARLRQALCPLRIPVDLPVYSADEVEDWGKQTGSALYWALREGKTLYG